MTEIDYPSDHIAQTPVATEFKKVIPDLCSGTVWKLDQKWNVAPFRCDNLFFYYFFSSFMQSFIPISHLPNSITLINYAGSACPVNCYLKFFITFNDNDKQ